MGIQFFSRDIGDASNNKVTVDWAYGDYRFKDWLGVRAGRIKLPMGLYNEIRDVDMLRTSIVLPQGIYNDMLRDTLIAVNGAGIYGNVNVGAIGGLEYQALTGAVYSDPDSGANKVFDDSINEKMTGAATIGTTENGNCYAAAIRWETPLPGLRMGYSYFKSNPENEIGIGGTPMALMEGTSQFHIGSAEFVWNDLTVVGEYYARNSESTIISAAWRTDTSKQRRKAIT